VLAQGPDGISLYYVAPEGACGGEAPCYDCFQDAVDAADDPQDVIQVAEGTYDTINNYGDTSQIVYVDKEITIRGGYSLADWNSPDPVLHPTIIDAQELGRGVVISGVVAVLDGLVITGGDASGLGGFSDQGFVFGDAGGGILAIDAPATIANCIIEGNQASTKPLVTGYGGGVFGLHSPLVLLNNIIRDNTASTAHFGNGGGAYFAPALEPITLTGNLFEDNTASSAQDGWGGGLFIESSQAFITDNTLRGNVASAVGIGKGGGLCILEGDLTLQGCTLSDNIAGKAPDSDTVWGGGLYAWDSDLTLLSNRILRNTANMGDAAGYGLGGGLYVTSLLGDKQLIATDNTIEGNIASMAGAGFGGGILMRGMNANLEGNTISDNIAGFVSGSGGGVFLGPDYAVPASHITLTRNVFRGNTAARSGTGNGGGLYMGALPPVGSSQQIVTAGAMLANNSIISNTASVEGSGCGGGLVLGGGTRHITVTNNLIEGNIASSQGEGRGGGVHFEGSSGSTVISNTIRENSASIDSRGYGGGISVRMSIPTLSQNTIVGNIASAENTGRGGGIYVFLSQVALTGHMVRDNIASMASDGQGGGLCFEVGTDIALSGNTVISNSATLSPTAAGRGGGLYASDSDPFFLTNNIFGANQAPDEGSGLWLGGYGGATLLHTTIGNNGGAGQGIYAGTDYTVACTNTIISGHTDAGVVSTGDGTFALAHTLWYDNAVNLGGLGTIAHSDDYVGDPVFAAPDLGDYHIMLPSVAIDVGANAGVTTDIDGDPRACLGGYDVGADELCARFLYLPIEFKP
jgi:parallel beta-helix repeat protein